MPSNYYNPEKQPLYILHFPGDGLIGHENIIEENLDRSFQISDEISIISIMNKECYNESFLAKQCEKNHIKIHNTALYESDWTNTIKIEHILQCLFKIDTPYVLILDGRDTIIIHDLDTEFLSKYKSFKTPIIYNGTPVAYPKKAIEPIQEIIKIKGKQKFLNAGVCIGEKNALINFYEKAVKIKDNLCDNNSEQLIIRMCRQQNMLLAGIDHNNNLFRIIHHYDTKIQSYGKDYILQ